MQAMDEYLSLSGFDFGRLPATADWQVRHPAIRCMRPIEFWLTIQYLRGACRYYPWRIFTMFCAKVYLEVRILQCRRT